MPARLPIRSDPVPVCHVGPRTIQCSECSYEAVFILPEEADIMIATILQHIQQHGIEIPNFTCTMY